MKAQDLKKAASSYMASKKIWNGWLRPVLQHMIWSIDLPVLLHLSPFHLHTVFNGDVSSKTSNHLCSSTPKFKFGNVVQHTCSNLSVLFFSFSFYVNRFSHSPTKNHRHYSIIFARINQPVADRCSISNLCRCDLSNSWLLTTYMKCFDLLKAVFGS